MAINYPSALDGTAQFPQPQGSTLLTDPNNLHAQTHDNLSQFGTALEAMLGTNSGTSTLKNFSIGDFAVRINSSNVLQQPLTGTLGMSAGSITGQITNTGTVANGLYGTATFQGGAVNNATIGTMNATGGTINTPTITGGTLSTTDWDGWSQVNGTLTYSSTDGHTFVATTNIDFSGVIGNGDRIKINQGGNQYFLVTNINSGTITLYGGTTAGTLGAGTFTNPSYSHMKAPFGFPLNPITWTEEFKDTSNRTQANPAASTWYNLGAASLAIPIGIWDVSYQVAADGGGTANGQPQVITTLGTTNNGQTDADFSAGITYQFNSAIMTVYPFYATRTKVLNLGAKTTYYLNVQGSPANMTSVDYNGATSPTLIRARSSYL